MALVAPSGNVRAAHVARPEGVTAPLPGATIVDRADLTDTIARLRVRPDGEPSPFVPGQYVTIGLAANADRVERPYSIASSARRLHDGYELYVRLVPGGALTPLLFATRPGDRVSLRRPKGRFTLRPDDDRTHLFVATGCGLAPFMSMLRTLDDDRAPRRVVLLHGVSYADELGYRAEIERWAADPRWSLTYVPTISRPREARNAGWSGRTGRAEAVLGPLLGELGIRPDLTVAYVCGNPEMTVAVDLIMRGAGFDGAAIHKELYWPLDRSRS
jgi:ferredoxin--NADP+ reductase